MYIYSDAIFNLFYYLHKFRCYTILSLSRSLSLQIGQWAECNLFLYNLLIDPVFNNTNKVKIELWMRAYESIKICGWFCWWSLNVHIWLSPFYWVQPMRDLFLLLSFALKYFEIHLVGHFRWAERQWPFRNDNGPQSSGSLQTYMLVWLFVYYCSQPFIFTNNDLP